jgi:hypothetical protein
MLPQSAKRTHARPSMCHVAVVLGCMSCALQVAGPMHSSTSLAHLVWTRSTCGLHCRHASLGPLFVQVLHGDHVVVVDKPDDATIHRFAEIVNVYTMITVRAVVSNARVQVAVVEPTSEVPGGLPFSLHPVPHVVLRTVPGVVPEEEARALLRAPLLPSARLPASVTMWGQLTLLRPEEEPEVESAVAGAPVPHGPPSDPPGAYTVAGRWQWGAAGCVIEGGVCLLVAVTSTSRPDI